MDRTRGTHTQKPSSHLNTHGKWHLHTSHLRQIHHCLNPHTQIPAQPLSLGVSWYLANCFQEIVGNRVIRGRTQAEIVGKKGTRRTSQRSSSRRKRRRRKRRRGGRGGIIGGNFGSQKPNKHKLRPIKSSHLNTHTKVHLHTSHLAKMASSHLTPSTPRV